MQLANQQEAEDTYYLTSNYIRELAKRAYELFKSSEPEEKRLLMKMTLSNLRVKHDLVCYDALKPFDLLLNFAKCSDWGSLLNEVRTFHYSQIEEREIIENYIKMLI